MMEINIKLMSEVAYITFQKNPEDVYKMIVDHPLDSMWVKEYLGFEPYEDKEYSIEDFELESNENSLEVTVEQGILLYEHLKHLPRYIVCNPRFWAWITLEKAYKVARKISVSLGVDFISSAWLISETRKSLMQGIISRYFFMVQISVEEKKAAPYELTKFLFSNPETYLNFSYRNIGMLKNVTLAVLHAQKDICDEFHISLMTKQISDMVKETSKIGSVMLIDIMRLEDIYAIIYPKFLKILMRK